MEDKGPTIYRRLKVLARPIIEHYHADLAVHDLNTLNKTKRGDLFLWSARKHGTHMIRVKDHRSATKHQASELIEYAREFYLAAKSLNKENQWYMIEVLSDRRGHVVPVDDREARKLVGDKNA